MKKTAFKILIPLILVLLFTISSTITVSAAKPEPSKSVIPDPAVTVYAPGTINPLAEFTFNDIGCNGIRYRWHHYDASEGTWQFLANFDEIWFDKRIRSGTYDIDCPVSVTVDEGDIVRVDVYLSRKNGFSVKNGTVSYRWDVTAG